MSNLPRPIPGPSDNTIINTKFLHFSKIVDASLKFTVNHLISLDEFYDVLC